MKLILKRSTLKNKRAETDVRDNTKNETPFQPEYAAAGNQTLIKTTTGIWSVVYNADNRPTSFTQASPKPKATKTPSSNAATTTQAADT